MATDRRRLVAILAADVVGYSRLVGADEAGTLARLRALLAEAIRPVMRDHGGRIFKLMGDAFLAEFGSAVDAVRAAAALQAAMAAREAPDLRLRIGVHLGDVVVEGSDLLGDGVNIAARLEGEAEPGGVAVSASVAEAVRGRVPFVLEDRGERTLKNIDRPLRVFRLATPQAAPAEPVLALPDKPSLVVLPFQNMSGDAEQDYFVDGLVEDITTALSCIRSFFVIARNSAFTYKGRAVDVRQVGRELGVRYVLEGSVRKAGGRIRITGQLIDATTGAHLWADRFDGTADDLFDLQDRVTEAVAGAIEPNLRHAEIARAQRKPTANLDAYDHYLRALPHHYAKTREDSDAALGLLRQAVRLDPGFSLAKAFAAYTMVQNEIQGWSDAAERSEGARLAREALANPQDDPATLRWAGHAIAWLVHDRVRGLAALERALALNPNSAQVLGSAGWVLIYVGQPDPAIDHFRRAIRLSPLDPEMSTFQSGLGMALVMARQFDDALEAGKRSVGLLPQRATGHRVVIAALHGLGRLEEARAAATRYQDANAPGARVFAARIQALFADTALVAHLVAALRQAGLPE